MLKHYLAHACCCCRSEHNLASRADYLQVEQGQRGHWRCHENPVHSTAARLRMAVHRQSKPDSGQSQLSHAIPHLWKEPSLGDRRAPDWAGPGRARLAVCLPSGPRARPGQARPDKTASHTTARASSWLSVTRVSSCHPTGIPSPVGVVSRTRDALRATEHPETNKFKGQ